MLPTPEGCRYSVFGIRHVAGRYVMSGKLQDEHKVTRCRSSHSNVPQEHILWGPPPQGYTTCTEDSATTRA